MQKLLPLLLLSLGLIGNSYAHILHCSLEETQSGGLERCYLKHEHDEYYVEWTCKEGYIKNSDETRCIKTSALSSSEKPPILSFTQSATKYIEKVLELTEKRKLLNPESDEKEYEEIAYALEEEYLECFNNVIIAVREQERIIEEDRQKDLQKFRQLISQAIDKRKEVGNRCSLSMDESCEKDIEEADSNIERARERLQRVKSTQYELITLFQYAKTYCPNWSSINNESIEEINDSDS